MTYPYASQMVAAAWLDAAFMSLLRDDAKRALEVWAPAFAATNPEQLVAVADNETVHHLIVCTPCSCWSAALGPTPDWYKSATYRQQAATNPRPLLESLFGTVIPPEVAILPHDSDTNRRYMVIPRRPQGTDQWTQAQLEAIVTANVLTGTELPHVS